MSKSSKVVLPTRSRTSTFRVPIKQPERWKVQSIALFKRKQADKDKQLEAKLKLLNMGKDIKGKGGGNNNAAALDNKKKNPVSIQHTNSAIEHIKRELEILHNNSTVIRNKMQALNSVRTSLLWLLKKSSALERSVIN